MEGKGEKECNGPSFLPSTLSLSLLDGGGAGHTHANMMGGGGDASKVSVAISGKWKFNSAVVGWLDSLDGCVTRVGCPFRLQGENEIVTVYSPRFKSSTRLRGLLACYNFGL